MKNNKITCLFFFLLSLTISAQRPDAVTLDRINTVTAGIQTLECDFVQTKQIKMLNDSMVSQGKMYYQQSDKLRWEYVKPYSYVFMLNGNKVCLKNATRKDVIDVNHNKLFKEIARIMMSSVVGGNLTDTKSFSIDWTQSPLGWKAVLTPKRKELQSMFIQISVHFNKSSYMVSRVDLKEKNGDLTTIELRNVKKNVSLPSTVFSVH